MRNRNPKAAAERTFDEMHGAFIDGSIGVPNEHLYSSELWYSHELGRWIRETDSRGRWFEQTEIVKVRMGRGYSVVVETKRGTLPRERFRFEAREIGKGRDRRCYFVLVEAPARFDVRKNG